MQRSNEVHGENYRIQTLKEKQADSLVAAKDHDTLVILPTGYGKTIIIQCLPFLEEQPSVIIIVNPLNTIIEEESSRFGKHCQFVDDDFIKGLTSPEAATAQDLMNVQNVQNGKILYLLGHPEKIASMEMKKFLMREPLASKVIKVLLLCYFLYSALSPHSKVDCAS